MYYVQYEYLDASDEYFEWVDEEISFNSMQDALEFKSTLNRDNGQIFHCISEQSIFSYIPRTGY